MGSDKKFLLGRGERLTHNVHVSRSGGSKNPPYSLTAAIARMRRQVGSATEYAGALPPEACPGGKVVAEMTMHPRYISKSDFPTELCRAVGLEPVGGKSSYVIPDEWGVNSHPEGAVADTWYVSATREALRTWGDSLSASNATWIDHEQASDELRSVERFLIPKSTDKVRHGADGASSHTYEVVLHAEESTPVLEAFYAFAASVGAELWQERVRSVGGVLFLPLVAEQEQIAELSKFAFMRAIRPMPALRTFRPPMLRGDYTPLPPLPTAEVLDEDVPVAIFDGGLPTTSPLHSWANAIEPGSIGAPVPAAQAHGEQVTSAALFGHVTPGQPLERPYTRIDHVRVIDENSGSGGDVELYDVLDRILEHLDSAEERYRFVNLSLGPDIPFDDEEIDRWTAELDARATGGDTFISVAAGNSGDRDSTARLNRIQPPSDGVNVLAVGACDSPDHEWGRCDYSSVGPGRTPGVAKPDGLAFGGCFARPFGVIDSVSGVGLSGTQGTSFAAPFALHTALGVGTMLQGAISPLGIRALFVHGAEQAAKSAHEVGWGRFEADPDTLLECADDEVTIIYEGVLPLKEYLRTPIPTPGEPLEGMVEIAATLVIAPEIDPAFAHAYTRGGLQVVFRPNSEKVQDSDSGKHADSEDFFSRKNLYKAAEYELRQDGHKWEPCWKASRRKRASSLLNPCFDIYYHTRSQGRADREPDPIPYALIVTLRARKVPDLYERILRAYSDLLIPLEPQIEIPTTV